jgi:hypothetical protein
MGISRSEKAKKLPSESKKEVKFKIFDLFLTLHNASGEASRHIGRPTIPD